MAIFKFDLLFDLGLTFYLEKVQANVLGQTTYVGEVWIWSVENYDLYCGKCDNIG